MQHFTAESSELRQYNCIKVYNDLKLYDLKDHWHTVLVVQLELLPQVALGSQIKNESLRNVMNARFMLTLRKTCQRSITKKRTESSSLR